MDHFGLLKGIEIIEAFKAALHLTGCFLAFATRGSWVQIPSSPP